MERQLPWLRQVLAAELRSAGRQAAALADAPRDAAYAAGYLALETLFPGARAAGDIRLPSSQIRTLQQADITLLAPGGAVNAGELVPSSGTPKPASQLGIVTVDGGSILAATAGNFEVNQSRVFTLKSGNVLLWSSDGNIDAGRGAKTVTGAPAPVLRLDSNGNLVVDTSGSFTGSGIAVLDASNTLDLYAPRGEINAGDAGIVSRGNAFFGAVRFVGTDNLNVGGQSIGAPAPVVTGGTTASLAGLNQAANATSNAAANSLDSAGQRSQGPRRIVFLDFLGFGEDPN
ncbi:filamentous haemagglutinin family protein [Aquincola sp. J276]|uniref:filamentous haemagglutinin family protein n=1 Tax=Aquincola sp. J276 TaxID=2898432 RepID=UPI002150CEC2|nr:filamentous haemagglutinin family protein [Aquincola sp. J276]MCR5867674.1 filamentous hemagglutinin family protein [Aquincola sp. J276]